MSTKVFPSLIVLIPALALSTADAQTPPVELHSWSIEQLCASRDHKDAGAELERREIFSSRELRQIRQGSVARGMSEEALICSLGEPEIILPAVVKLSPDPVVAYIYPPGESDAIVAYVMRAAEGSTVVYTAETDQPEAFVADASTRLICTTYQGGNGCRLAVSQVDCGTGMADISTSSVLQPCFPRATARQLVTVPPGR